MFATFVLMGPRRSGNMYCSFPLSSRPTHPIGYFTFDLVEQSISIPSTHYILVEIFTDEMKMILAAAAKLLQLCPTLCDPIDGSPLGSPIPGILQARTLEWVASSFSNAWKWKLKVKSLSRVQLSDPMDCSPIGPSVHRIFQARVLEWGAIAFSNDT